MDVNTCIHHWLSFIFNQNNFLQYLLLYSSRMYEFFNLVHLKMSSFHLYFWRMLSLYRNIEIFLDRFFSQQCKDIPLFFRLHCFLSAVSHNNCFSVYNALFNLHLLSRFCLFLLISQVWLWGTKVQLFISFAWEFDVFPGCVQLFFSPLNLKFFSHLFLQVLFLFHSLPPLIWGF